MAKDPQIPDNAVGDAQSGGLCGQAGVGTEGVQQGQGKQELLVRSRRPAPPVVPLVQERTGLPGGHPDGQAPG